LPIYEYLCGKCNLIFQFFVRSQGGADPACPKCGAGGLERVMSTFAPVRGNSSQASSGDGVPADLAGLDESDPRAMARAIRRMADEMGEGLGPELDEAITRLEAGEDPEQVERELEDAGLDEDDDAGSQHPGPPSRDPGLYDA